MGRRAEQRIEISLPVRVWGMDRNGKPFFQSAYTADITRSGARLRDLYCLDRTGEVIRIQHGSKKANFTIRWIGHPGTASDGQAGICSLDPDRYIWGVTLPQSSPTDVYQVRTPVKPFLAQNQENTSAFAGLSPTPLAAEAAKVTRMEGRSGEMRSAARYACNGMAEVGPEGGSIPIWCSVSDISISGCYAETTSPLPIDTLVYIRLKIIGVQVQALGVVRTMHHGVGMGIEFTEMNDEDQIELRSILQALATRAESGEAAFAPNPVLFAAKPSPELLSDRSLLVVHNRPQTETAKKPAPAADPQICERLQQLIQELESLPAAFQPNAVDPRVLQEFKCTVEHVGRTAGALRQWMELQSQNRDPFPAFHKLNEDRVRVVAGLNHRISMDIDGGDIDLDNAGLKELFDSTKDLYTRLQKLFKKW